MLKFLKSKAFIASLFIFLAASVLGKYLSTFPGLSLIGHLVIALIIGMALQLPAGIRNIARSGSGFVAAKFLRLGIILMGFRLNLHDLIAAGPRVLLLAAVVVIFTTGLVYKISRFFKESPSLSFLTGAGCGICGAAAVMGVSPAIEAEEDDTVLAIAAVCILGTVFSLILVFLRPMMGLSATQFGVVAGASLHEIAHAVAAGDAGGPASSQIAIITKLARVLMLVPMTLIVEFIYTRNRAGLSGGSAADSAAGGSTAGSGAQVNIPWFMVGFLLSSIVGTYIQMPNGLIDNLVLAAYVFLAMAMAALGVNVNFTVLRERGFKVLLAGFLGTTALFGVTITAAKLFF